jgi:integrase
VGRNAFAWLAAGGITVGILYMGARSRRRGASPDAARTDTVRDSEARNAAALKYRPVGSTGEPYPDWVRALDGKSGVYIIRELQRDGTTVTVYEITKRFTVHGLRYTFTDLVRRANVDAVVRRALTGHVTEEMQRHYSTVGLDEKRAAIAGVLRLVPPDPRRDDRAGGTGGGTTFGPTSEVN